MEFDSIPPLKDLEHLRRILGPIITRISYRVGSLEGGQGPVTLQDNLEMEGKQIIGLGKPQQEEDAVRLADLQELEARLTGLIKQAETPATSTSSGVPRSSGQTGVDSGWFGEIDLVGVKDGVNREFTCPILIFRDLNLKPIAQLIFRGAIQRYTAVNPPEGERWWTLSDVGTSQVIILGWAPQPGDWLYFSFLLAV